MLILFVILIVKLLWIVVILELSIRRASRGFREQIVAYGIRGGSARRISATYRSVMKKSVRDVFKRSIGGSVWVR